MKSRSFVFILGVLGHCVVSSLSSYEMCSGRWQMVDKLKIKITLDWQTLPKTRKVVTEFRTNLVDEGFWYAFGLSSASNKPGLVYALRRRENDSEVFWDVYNVTESKVSVIGENCSSVVTFQRLPTSGLLTVHPTLEEQPCPYLVYMRGRFANGEPLLPDEIRFNQSACLTCPRSDSTSTMLPTSTALTTERTRVLLEDRPTASPHRSPSFHVTRETNFFWFGRILNRSWSNDYYNLSSTSSEQLRLELQNLFLSLIDSNPSLSFICNRFELYALDDRSGSILFASNITLISNRSDDQTIGLVEDLIRTVNDSTADQLALDPAGHQLRRANEINEIDELFKRYASSRGADFPKQAEFDSALHLLIGCITGIGFLMTLITSILCLYGYYKCRRRRFRRFAEEQTLKFKPDIDAYAWLGQQPSISCSSPYLIQSTSI